jgi:hypothetical protein
MVSFLLQLNEPKMQILEQAVKCVGEHLPKLHSSSPLSPD